MNNQFQPVRIENSGLLSIAPVQIGTTLTPSIYQDDPDIGWSTASPIPGEVEICFCANIFGPIEVAITHVYFVVGSTVAEGLSLHSSFKFLHSRGWFNLNLRCLSEPDLCLKRVKVSWCGLAGISHLGCAMKKRTLTLTPRTRLCRCALSVLMLSGCQCGGA